MLDPEKKEGEEEKTWNKEKKPKKITKQEEEEQFAKEYKKLGGIQHIICSATLTVDSKGRLTPRKVKKQKKTQST